MQESAGAFPGAVSEVDAGEEADMSRGGGVDIGSRLWALNKCSSRFETFLVTLSS